MRLFFHFLPPVANPLLSDGVPILIQPTKQSLVPEHYIALAGDSYAMGLGDDFYHQAGKARAHYGSAPLIHKLSGKDVVSFGTAGNGSIAGMVSNPLATLAYWNAGWRVSVDDPEILLVYFYEGNDLNDNVEYLQHASKKRRNFDYAQLNNSAYFQDYIQDVALTQDALYQQARNLRWYDQLYLGKFVVRASMALLTQVPNLFNTEVKQDNTSSRSPLNPPGRFEWTEPGTLNRAEVNGKEIQLPDMLQGPSMDLTNDEKNIALVSFRESLRFLRQHLPHTKIVIVYLPSVISSYDIRSTQVSVQSHARRQQFVFTSSAVAQQSNWMAEQIQHISAAEKIAFVDSRPTIHKVSKTRLLHGPLDWNHFNQEGYQALTEALAPTLAETSLGHPLSY